MQISILKGGVKVRSRNIQADILEYISDGKTHTLQEIANAVEVSKKTVQRHVQDLTYRFDISTFCGGIEKGGIRLNKKKELDIDYLKTDELQLIITQLELLQNSNINIKRFIKSLRQYR